MVSHRLKQRQRALGVLGRIQRHHVAVFEADRFAVLMALVQKLRVFFLDVSGVAQHPVAEVDRRRSRVNRAVEAVLHQRGQVAAVVDVGVRKDHRIDRRAGHRQVAILCVRLLAPPLVEPAIERVSPTARFHQMHRAGDRPRRAPECDLHRPTAPAPAMDASKKADSSASRESIYSPTRTNRTNRLGAPHWTTSRFFRPFPLLDTYSVCT